MRNLTFQEWAYAMMTLLLLGWAGSIFSSIVLGVAAFVGLLALSVERFANIRRIHRLRKPCGELLYSHSGHASHPCALPADGHTLHRCGHGDCSWGS